MYVRKYLLFLLLDILFKKLNNKTGKNLSLMVMSVLALAESWILCQQVMFLLGKSSCMPMIALRINLLKKVAYNY